MLENSEYERLRDLINARTGIYFSPDKRERVQRQLETALQEAGYTEADSYYAALYRDAAEGELWSHLIRRVTIGETYFFRDKAQFQALRENILPALIQERRRSNHRALRLWSAGCSTGEEPYSLAILLRELIYDINEWNIFILGTDINQDSLDFAARGFFSSYSFRAETPETIKPRYFLPVEGGWELLSAIRQMVRFKYLNLASDNYPSFSTLTTRMDVVMCRNVTIYFDRETTKNIAQRFHQSLLKDGWLVVGHSEPLSAVYAGFEPRNFPGAVIYRRTDATQASATTQPDFVQPASPGVRTVEKSVKPLVSSPTEDASPAIESRPAEPERREESGPSYAQECYEKGKQLADEMKWSEAHQWLTRALAHNPVLADAHYIRALIYMHEGDDPAAEEALKRVMYLQRDFVLAHFNLGLLYQRQGKIQEAHRAWVVVEELLRKYNPGDCLPFSDDLTAGYLRRIVNTYLKSPTGDLIKNRS